MAMYLICCINQTRGGNGVCSLLEPYQLLKQFCGGPDAASTATW